MAKRALPYVKWFPRDILDDPRVETMTIAQEGAYRRLLDVMWTLSEDKPVFRGLPDADAFLARVCKMQPATWKKTRSVLFGGDDPVMIVGDVDGYGGRVLNVRLQREHRAAVSFVEDQSQKGSKGGKTKAPSQAPAKPKLSQPQANQNQNQSTSTKSAIADLDDPPETPETVTTPDEPQEQETLALVGADPTPAARTVSEAQELVNRVIELGMRGSRPATNVYARWAARAKQLLAQRDLDWWLTACDGMGLIFPHSGSQGSTWDVFDLGRKGEKAFAEATKPPPRASPRKPIVRTAAGAAFADLADEQMREQEAKRVDAERVEADGGPVTGTLPEHTE